ncbi:MAG: hypothetical protein WCJ30_27970, partial [Deltaproteobacteria bacterium]
MTQRGRPSFAPHENALAPVAPRNSKRPGVIKVINARQPPEPIERVHAPFIHGHAPAESAPIGAHGLPFFESEIGVLTETNFYTDILGDIRHGGGIFVETLHVLPLGAQCEVRLTFPGSLVAEFSGVVTWKRENAPGVSAELA